MSAADGDAADGDADGDAADGDAGTSGSSSSETCTIANSSKLRFSAGTGLTLDGLIMVLTPLVDGSGDGALDDGLGGVCTWERHMNIIMFRDHILHLL